LGLVSDGFTNQVAYLDVIQLKNNVIPKGLVPPEKLFDHNDVAKNPKVVPTKIEVEECNIGTKKPKMVMLSITLTHGYRQKYLDLIKKYSNIFSSGYEDLKVYDKSIIQHTIPIK